MVGLWAVFVQFIQLYVQRPYLYERLISLFSFARLIFVLESILLD